MDKQTIRRLGIKYRTSLTQYQVRTKSHQMNELLNELLHTLPEPYMTYTALLPGELDPTAAFYKRHVTIIEPTKYALMPDILYSTIIIPMVAADRYGNRIGMGGGWFDRFLATQKDAVIIGCCYDKMVIDHIPTESFDVQVDYICTELRTINCSVE